MSKQNNLDDENLSEVAPISDIEFKKLKNMGDVWKKHDHQNNIKAIKSNAVLFVMAVITVIVGVFGLISYFLIPFNNTRMKELQAHYDVCYQMIDKAKENPNLVKTATIVDHKYYKPVNMWAYEYEIKYENPSNQTEENFILTGYSHIYYSGDEIQRYAIGSQISVAVDSTTLWMCDKSIPMEYEKFTYDNDGEYIKAQNTKSFGLTMCIVCGVVAAISIVIFIVLMSKNKQTLLSIKELEEVMPEDNESIDEENNENKPSYCSYCGEEVDKGAKKCNACGASLNKKSK